MARLRQQYPQNYGSSGNISTEFENLIRYLNAAELGNKTVGELLGSIFDDNGDFDGPIEFQKDQSGDIQYRIGEYDNTSEGWQTLVSADEIRGTPGRDVGDIGAPIFYGRADYVATAGQTAFDYAHVASDTLLVYVNGILKRPGALYDYTSDAVGGTASAGVVTFNAGLSLNDRVSVFKVRSTAITGYNRTDTYTSAPQAVFPFVFEEDTKLQVYKNGILQREGSSYDYTTQPDNNTITFTSTVAANNLVTIITVENISSQAVTGLMLEEQFCHTDSGLIRLDRIRLDNNAISQAKVSNLSTDLSAKAKISVSSTTPTSPGAGNLWLDTSQSPNLLKFYNGTEWLRTSPDSSLPSYASTDAGKFVRVNGTGTSLEYATVDLSSVIPVTQRGAANGVASLDSTGRLPSSQLPSALSSISYYLAVASPTNQTYTISRIFKQKIRIEGISVRTSSGTCNVQIAINGVAQGAVYSASSLGSETTISSTIEVDSSASSRAIGFIVTSASSAVSLEVTIAASILSN